MSGADNNAKIAKSETPVFGFDTATSAAPADTQAQANLIIPYTQQRQQAIDPAGSNDAALVQESARKTVRPPAPEPAKAEEVTGYKLENQADEGRAAASRISNQRNMAVAAPAAANREEQAVRDQATNNARALAPFAANSFNGRVVDPENKPIAGASVIVKSKELGVSTDKDGNFNVILPDSNIQVRVGSVGFESRELTLKTSLTDNRIVLKPLQEEALSEVVTSARPDGKRSENKISSVDEAPVISWPQYQHYLSQNKRIPVLDSAIHGIVIISFTVNKRGKPTDLKVEQSLTRSHDAEALRLVREGPAWKTSKAKTRRRIAIPF
jgi:hypothetical protein